ncbi:MAG: RsmB/NOP family class I SAM-dependent RNA methyltransferase [Taibaiella sp.]|nr:RsmB/NOP family class I SAM-dependent RNA methyltransferase [Taibaiella sp.]
MRYIKDYAENIIRDYRGAEPLAQYLKNYFRLYPKLGSRDRKMISDMAYSWYRCSKAITGTESTNNEVESKLQACILLCSANDRVMQTFLPADWKPYSTKSIEERVALLSKSNFKIDTGLLAPFDSTLSEGIGRREWLNSMWIQPRLFIRIRKEKDKITDILNDNNIPFVHFSDNCLSLPNGAAIDKLLPQDAYVVQDASSQKTGTYFNPKDKEVWYDCCAGAGGKSLLLKDMEQNVLLTVSDKRENILHNLKNRFSQYHIEPPEVIITDVSDAGLLAKQIDGRSFDGIICDVPCSGSGTWARNPEELYYFNKKKIRELPALQTQIACNAVGYLKDSGRIIYITCSVFKEENEDVVNEIAKQTGLTIEHLQIINGIDDKADSMFVAVLRKL